MRRQYGTYITLVEPNPPCLRTQDEAFKEIGDAIHSLLQLARESGKFIDWGTMTIMVRRPEMNNDKMTVGIKYEVEEEDVDNNISGCGLKY